MNEKKIILCPNPSRDQGMKTTRAAEQILHEMGFHTVVCSPFRDQKEGLFAGYSVQPLPQELKSADLLITFGGDGTILHLARLRSREPSKYPGLQPLQVFKYSRQVPQ